MTRRKYQFLIFTTCEIETLRLIVSVLLCSLNSLCFHALLFVKARKFLHRIEGSHSPRHNIHIIIVSVMSASTFQIVMYVAP